MIILKGIFLIIAYCVIYLAFGSLFCIRKDRNWSVLMTGVVGFFAYYGLFAIVCMPIMLTYRPLSLLSKVWLTFACVVLIVSSIINCRSWRNKFTSICQELRINRGIYIAVGILVLIQIILVAFTYNFTLDAAYYVANVSTSVDTNMINVYDPFTGAWQDHFELRYVFATYSIQDAVICQVTEIPALVETKFVMSSIVMIMANSLYVWLCRFLCSSNTKQQLVMYIGMVFVNFTFITIYTSSNFLMTRTYEGKSVVGNVAVIAIFAIYMMAVRNGMDNYLWLILFAVCLGTATVSSTANMLLPAEVCVLFVPYLFRHRMIKSVWKMAVCILPEIVMMLVYVLYVKGYFAVYTYPR